MPRQALYLLTAVNVLNYLDRALVAAVMPSLLRELNLTQQQGGELVAAFVVGYMVFSPIFGFLGDRKNRLKLMCIGVILWSLATIATAWSYAYLAFYVARVAVGVGEASFGTIAPGYLKDRFKEPAAINSALSLFYSSMPVGFALGYAVGGLASTNLSWHWAFYLGGIPGLLLAPLLLRFPDVRSAVAPAPPFKEGLLALSRVPALWYAIGGYVLNSFALYGLSAFVTTYGKSLGFREDEMGVYFGLILFVSGIAGTMGGGKFASWYAARSPRPIAAMFRVVGGSAMLAFPLLVLALTGDDKWMFLAFCFLAQLFMFTGTAPINTILVLSCPPQLVTLTQGVSIFALNLFGSFLAPPIVGWVADHHSLREGLLVCSVALLLAGVVWLLGSRAPGQNAENTPETSASGT